jgi:hypothetical protein
MAAWGRVKGWRKKLDIETFGHFTYSYAPLILKLAGLELPPRKQALVKTVEGRRAFGIVTTYLRAFVGFVFTGRGRIF